MRYLVFAFCMMFSVAVIGQDLTTSPVLVLEKTWKAQTKVPTNSVLNADPFQPGRDAAQLMSDRRATVEANKTITALGRDRIMLPTGVRINNGSNSNYNTYYTYKFEFKLQNTSSKPVSRVEFFYVFSDRTTGAEIGRKSFTVRKKFKPFATKKWKFEGLFAPTGTINVNDYGRESGEMYSESIEVVKVVYADGTEWVKN